MPDPVVFDPKARPTKELINKQSEYLTNQVWKESYGLMKKAWQFYAQEYDIWASLRIDNPEEAGSRPLYCAPVATAKIDQAVDSVFSATPKFHKPPAGDGDSHKDRANRVEKALQDLFEDGFTWNPLGYPPRMNQNHLLLYNYTQLFVGLNPLVLEPKPERMEGEDQEDFEHRERVWENSRHTSNPFIIEVTKPDEVLMNPMEKVPSIAIRRKQMHAYELHNITTTKTKKLDVLKVFEIEKDAYEKVEVEEWWSPFYVAVRKKDGDVLWVEKNDWGFQPHMHTFGIGATAPIGQNFNPKYLINKGLLFPMMETILLHDQTYVAHHNVNQRKAWARLGSEGEAAQLAEQMRGRYLEGDPEKQWLELTPELGAQSFTELERLDQLLEESGFSKQAAGFPSSDIDTATQAVILSEATGRKGRPYVLALNALYSMAAGNALKLAKVLFRDYPFDNLIVGEHELKAADIEDFRVIAKFENKDAVVFQQEKQQAMAEVKEGFSSMKKYWRIVGEEDDTS